MATAITRTIHPIGQGAFYSEQLTSSEGEKFTIVYDCGCGQGKDIPSRAKNVVEGWLNDGKTIDILFISHFHNDHINGVKELIDRTRYVVLPYLKNPIMVALGKLKHNLEQIDPNIISYDTIDPSNYQNTHFLYVTSAKDSDPRIVPIQKSPQNLRTPADFGQTKEQFQDIEDKTQYTDRKAYFQSGDMINSFGWYYMPFTRETPTNDEEMLDAINKLNEFIESRMSQGNGQNGFKTPNFVKEVKKLYEEIDNKLNETSMLLFSSPMSVERCNDDENDMPSCLYTGDIKLSDEIKGLIYKKLDPYKIGTLQVPHHGSHYCWCFFECMQCKIYNLDSPNLYFCSHGLNNRYSHPHKKVMDDFSSHGKLLYGINDNASTKKVQTFNI